MHISVKNLKKIYANQTVLDDISFEIKNHKAIGIIGESGCGKSTLLRQLAGIEMPDFGDILINDLSPITHNKNFRKKIGFVFQKHNLFPHLSVKENITLILHKIRKFDKSHTEKVADDLLKKLHIDSISHKKPNAISGGQAQRASIARALALDPELIFLDEPTAALDPVLTDEVLKSVKKLKSDGRNFIFVTHEISFLKEFADYIIFLKNGKILECGDVNLLKSPKTSELSEFLRIH